MEPDSWRNKTICIIDDDVNVRDIYRTKFEREGFFVVTAENGEVGLRLIREKHPDIIIVDMQMPILDGLGVLRILKDDARLSRIPAIVLSNVEDDTVFQQVEELGFAQYYLIKSLTDSGKVVDIVLRTLADQ
jgi:two-component system, sensor histidine kinase and response regulator